MARKDERAVDFYADPANQVSAGPARRLTSPRRPLTGHMPVRFDDATIAAVKERADANGMTVSAWIRRLVDRELAPVDTPPTSDGDALVVRIPAGTRRVTLELRGAVRRASRRRPS